ncbi:MAG TPA: hypothetical protein VH023_16355 [Rhodopila sp.]|nr:hypothetical protein [Rhodopila sp.]
MALHLARAADFQRLGPRAAAIGFLPAARLGPWAAAADFQRPVRLGP